MAIQWLLSGHDVYIVSIWLSSRAACTMLYHLLHQSLRMQQTSGVPPGRVRLLTYDFNADKDMEMAVNDLSQAAKKGSLYVIADEVGLDEWSENFQTFCDKLFKLIPRLHLWAASCYHDYAPNGWHIEYLTRPLRSPPVVVREVALDPEINDHKRVHPYRERGVPDHTDGPPVRRLYHRGQGHPHDWPGDCATCGHEVASFLHSLHTDETSTDRENISTRCSVSTCTTSPSLQWRDVLVLDWGQPKDDLDIIKAMKEAGIPVRVMKDDDIEDVAKANTDVVWVADGELVRGLERKVVVCLESPCAGSKLFIRLNNMSRCTAQLVIVSSEDVSSTEFCFL
ncbi:uncharacterized protein LOC112575896 isoform X1 [Pomacea canaliculata]|uniref:uncharacterized protein LOC112575896 isoform X1 n=1 Tax=Pomacea canaliculata TaxID=400727 RepID=UPI000D72EAF0|nr:uncharacterized protein LOC112575896 isoform X1 [Pomacea canaliculata]